MSRFTLDEEAFGKHVLQADFMRDEMKRRAELVMARAIATAPVDKHHDPEKGLPYKDSFLVRTGTRPKGYDPALERSFPTSRAYAQVVNTKSYARHVEFGTGRGIGGRSGLVGYDEKGRAKVRRRNTPRFRVLGRALDAAKG